MLGLRLNSYASVNGMALSDVALRSAVSNNPDIIYTPDQGKCFHAPTTNKYVAYYYGHPSAKLADGHYILLRYVSIIFFRRLISEVSGRIVTKLRHVFGGDCNL